MIIGVAGAGNMAGALARGIAGAGGGHELLVFDVDAKKAEALAAETGGRAVEAPEALVAKADLVVLAFKPANLTEAAPAFVGAKTVVSLLGGTSTAAVREALGPGPGIVRIMPNVAVEVGAGVICLPPADGVPDAELADVRSLLESVASVVELPEGQLDAATTVMACSPAFIAEAAGAIARAGATEGLDPEVAAKLVAGAVRGTGELLALHEAGEISRAVASPGGSTEAGLAALAEAGGGEAFEAAVHGAMDKMR